MWKGGRDLWERNPICAVYVVFVVLPFLLAWL
jgi:hypothetical protein